MGLLIFSRPSSRITLHPYIFSLEHIAFPKRVPSQAGYSKSKTSHWNQSPPATKNIHLGKLYPLNCQIWPHGSRALCFLVMVLLGTKDILLLSL